MPSTDESQLRHPLERPIFVATAAMNVLAMVAAVLIVLYGVDVLKEYPLLAKHADEIRLLAIAAVFALPGVAVLRNVNRGRIRGNSMRLSREQLPEIYAIFERHCEKLGMEHVPELYLSDSVDASHAFSVRKRDAIVLSTDNLGSPADMSDVIAFTLGRELGALRLGHASWMSDLLLSYVSKVHPIKAPLSKVRTFSCDRYGAFLAPDGVRGLLVQVTGRRLLKGMNVADYLKQTEEFRGVWAQLARIWSPSPPIATRIRALYEAGLFQMEHDVER